MTTIEFKRNEKSHYYKNDTTTEKKERELVWGSEYDFKKEYPKCYKKWIEGGCIPPETFGNKSWREDEGEEFRRNLKSNGMDYFLLEVSGTQFEIFTWKE